MPKSRKKRSREPVIAKAVFITGLLVEILKYAGYQNIINENLLLIFPIFIIIFSLFFSLTYIDSWNEGITNMLVGITLYFSLTYAIVLFGTIGLNNDNLDVIEGLTRIAFALYVIWKLHADMRHIDLTLMKSQRKKRVELLRLIKIIFFVSMTFIFLTSGLELLKSSTVNPRFLEQTEEISTNILFVGLQSPLLMASRSSVSRTFANYLDNYSELVTRYQNNLDQLNSALNTYLSVKTLSYSEIKNEGKTLWVSIIFIFFLQAFKQELIALYTRVNIEEIIFELINALPF